MFSAAYPLEKVHLHFDNTSYYCGDTIWFKAYVSQGPKELTAFRTLHNGMGCLSYTPRAGVKVEAKITYNGDNYTFQLPEALPKGYMLNVTNRETTLDVRVVRNEATLSDTLALFISHQDIPLIWNMLPFGQKQAELLRIPTDQLPL